MIMGIMLGKKIADRVIAHREAEKDKQLRELLGDPEIKAKLLSDRKLRTRVLANPEIRAKLRANLVSNK